MISQSVKRRLEAAVVKVPRKRTGTRLRAVALSYHSITPTGPIASATPDLFRAHLEWLKEKCTLVRFSEFAARGVTWTPDRPVVALTFDDGYEDNFDVAFSALSDHGVPATFFLTTGLVERRPDVLRRFAALWRVPRGSVQGLAWPQIKEMHAAGMEFGAHTVSHPNLAACSARQAWAEMTDSRAVLEDRLGEAVTIFAYPFGNPRQHFSRVTMGLVHAAGFRAAAAVQFRGLESEDHALNIPRFPVTGDSLEVLHGKVYGDLDVLGRLRERAPRWAVSLTSTESAKRLRGYEQRIRNPRDGFVG